MLLILNYKKPRNYSNKLLSNSTRVLLRRCGGDVSPLNLSSLEVDKYVGGCLFSFLTFCACV